MRESIEVIFSAIGVVGGLLVAACGIEARYKCADIPRWVSGLVALFGILFVCWGGLGLVDNYASGHLSRLAIRVLYDCRIFFGGVATGLALAWWMSGQVSPFRRKRLPTGQLVGDSPAQTKL
jgi:hypothetical protein